MIVHYMNRSRRFFQRGVCDSKNSLSVVFIRSGAFAQFTICCEWSIFLNVACVCRSMVKRNRLSIMYAVKRDRDSRTVWRVNVFLTNAETE